MSLFSKMGFKPRNGAADGYPFDLDGSLRYVRPKTGVDYWDLSYVPNVNNFQKLGNVSGFMPMQDWRVWAQGYGKDPFGPIMNPAPLNLQYQATVPGLNKQMAQY